MRRWIVVLALLVVGAGPAAAQVDTGIVPADGRTTWAPGVTTGIPARGTVCATVQAATYGNGAAESSAGIQAALAACPPGQTVQLSAGTFLVNDYILINKAVTLRGAGPTATTLRKTNGAVQGSYMAEEYEPVVIIGPARWSSLDTASTVNLSTDGVNGSHAITVTSAAGFAAGQFVFLDEDDYSTATWIALPNRNGAPTTVKIWASDRVVFAKHDPPEPGDDPFPASLVWFSRSGRPINEIKEIAAVSGNTITFTTPLHAAYPTAKLAQVTRWTGPHLKGAGLEDLTVSGGSDSNVRFEAAAYSWVKNVESTAWLGEGVILNGSFRVEVRDSYVHDCVHPYPGGGCYGIGLAWASSEALIENNIVLGVNKVMAAKSAGAGSVVGYNYMDNAFIGNYLGWIEVGINGSHMVGPHHILFEGNQSHNYDSDDTHGSSFAMTIFRNHLVGRRRDYPNVDNIRAAGLMHGSWWHSFIGNVLGEPGATANIWNLGYTPKNWQQAADPKVLATMLRDGNFDYVTSSVKWDRPPQTLPASLYLSAKPAFFGSHPWPWVDPMGSTKLAVLPARERYEARFAGGPAPPPMHNLRILTAPAGP
jgi:hypothetical protein